MYAEQKMNTWHQMSYTGALRGDRPMKEKVGKKFSIAEDNY